MERGGRLAGSGAQGVRLNPPGEWESEAAGETEVIHWKNFMPELDECE